MLSSKTCVCVHKYYIACIVNYGVFLFVIHVAGVKIS